MCPPKVFSWIMHPLYHASFGWHVPWTINPWPMCPDTDWQEKNCHNTWTSDNRWKFSQYHPLDITIPGHGSPRLTNLTQSQIISTPSFMYPSVHGSPEHMANICGVGRCVQNYGNAPPQGPYTEKIDLWFEPFFVKEVRRVIDWLREIKTADQHCYNFF